MKHWLKTFWTNPLSQCVSLLWLKEDNVCDWCEFLPQTTKKIAKNVDNASFYPPNFTKENAKYVFVWSLVLHYFNQRPTISLGARQDAPAAMCLWNFFVVKAVCLVYFHFFGLVDLLDMLCFFVFMVCKRCLDEKPCIRKFPHTLWEAFTSKAKSRLRVCGYVWPSLETQVIVSMGKSILNNPSKLTKCLYILSSIFVNYDRRSKKTTSTSLKDPKLPLRMMHTSHHIISIHITSH